MKKTIPPVIIIYNPNSTGPSEAYAREFAEQLRQAGPSLDVTCLPTEYAGHAEKIAREYAAQNEPCLLIASSGDGGYHELVNGVLGVKTSKVIVGLLPGGNANDHYNAIHAEDVVDRILRLQTETIDVLRVDATMKGEPWTRYAHSYAGIGLTSYVGETLTKAKLNPLREFWIVATHLLTHRPVRIKRGRRTYYYSSIIFSNIDRMSKVLTLADNASYMDGKMEITEKESRHVLPLVIHFLRGALTGFKTERQAKSYIFTCVRRTSMQLDGEVYYFAPQTKVTVRVVPGALTCII